MHMHALFVLIFFLSSCTVALNKKRTSELNQSRQENLVLSLNPDTVTIVLEYVGWGCPCPQWISAENRLLYEEWKKENDSYPEDFFYNIEWGNSSLPDPLDALIKDSTETPWTFEFTGQFYKEPMFLGHEGELWKGLTLRYYFVRLLEK